MKNKGKNTTIVAYVGLFMSIAVLGSFMFGKIDMQQMLGAFGGIGTLIGVFVGFLAKDQNKSHSSGITPPPGAPPKEDDPDN